MPGFLIVILVVCAGVVVVGAVVCALSALFGDLNEISREEDDRQYGNPVPSNNKKADKQDRRQ